MLFWSIRGQVPYEQALVLQSNCLQRRHRHELEDLVLLLEHEPVFTLGRGNQREPERERVIGQGGPSSSIQWIPTNRGGGPTYHGPGQLVGYPIFLLNGQHVFAPYHDIGIYLRRLEDLIIGVLNQHYQVTAHRRLQATGVWTQDASGQQRKLVSIGIAVKHWVTHHGFAINVTNDPKAFAGFDPCGFNPEVMINLQSLTKLSASWRPKLENHLVQAWAPESRIRELDLDLALRLSAAEEASETHGAK